MKCRECKRITNKENMVLVSKLRKGKLNGELYCPHCGARMIWNVEVKAS
jgi:DNA-directed RNA polymerase subunit RPC12/RpoP